MNLTPDALQLGPLVLAWDRLILLLALSTWLGTAHVRHAGTAALVTLITARLAALPHWSELAPTFGGRLLTVLDIRAGDWAWPVGVTAGLVYLLTRLRGWLAARPDPWSAAHRQRSGASPAGAPGPQPRPER